MRDRALGIVGEHHDLGPFDQHQSRRLPHLRIGGGEGLVRLFVQAQQLLTGGDKAGLDAGRTVGEGHQRAFHPTLTGNQGPRLVRGCVLTDAAAQERKTAE